VNRHRVLVDIEFTVDEDRFKFAQIEDGLDGISDATAPAVRNAVSIALTRALWTEQGLSPLRSIVTSRSRERDGSYRALLVPGDRGAG
jgi:hypothetical protein